MLETRNNGAARRFVLSGRDRLRGRGLISEDHGRRSAAGGRGCASWRCAGRHRCFAVGTGADEARQAARRPSRPWQEASSPSAPPGLCAGDGPGRDRGVAPRRRTSRFRFGGGGDVSGAAGRARSSRPVARHRRNARHGRRGAVAAAARPRRSARRCPTTPRSTSAPTIAGFWSRSPRDHGFRVVDAFSRIVRLGEGIGADRPAQRGGDGARHRGPQDLRRQARRAAGRAAPA